jgi:mono/diheme cytochrome c family protein
MFRRVVLGLIFLIVVAVGVSVAIAWRSEMEPRDTAEPLEFDPALVEKGAALAAVGNCIACHTVPGQKAFAGGLALPTPFGTIYSTNITPDPETGIGLWTEEAFQRAMREGVDREGNHLYPAFPYDHYTRVTEEDNRALYAFLMTREPVRYTAPENELPFPISFRPILAGWKILFLDVGAFEPDPDRSEEWNRGAYLAEGLGHCGSCHTARNRFGALSGHWNGGEAEGWAAFAINEASPAPIPWDRESLHAYLRNGWHPHHGVSRGPMAEVTANLGTLPEADVRAIATYVASVMGEPTAERRSRADQILQDLEGDAAEQAASTDVQAVATSSDSLGASIYRSACATCHESGRPQPFGGLNLFMSAAVNAPNPQNLINLTLYGLPAADGVRSAVMPGFGAVMSDEELLALFNYIRDRFTDQPAWTDLPERLRATRSGEYHVRILPSDGIERGPSNIGASDDGDNTQN